MSRRSSVLLDVVRRAMDVLEEESRLPTGGQHSVGLQAHDLSDIGQ